MDKTCNMRHLLQKLKRKKFLLLLTFFVHVFCAGCQNRENQREKAALEHLFNYLLFEHSGVFVLFGSKPLCEAPLPLYYTEEEAQRLWAHMPENLKQDAQIILAHGNYWDDWETWKKVKSRFPMTKYLLVERSRSGNDKSIFLANVEQVGRLLEEQYALFREVVGRDFSPRKMVFELGDENSQFWKKVLCHHVTEGLLYGFGKENVEVFHKWMSSTPHTLSPSAQEPVEIGQSNAHDFTIPIFMVGPCDVMVRRYEEEKAHIEALYRDQDMLEVTLRQLTAPP